MCIRDRLYTKDSELIHYGDIYLRYMIPTYLCMSLSLTCTIVLRSVGEARLPLIAAILAFFVNVFFNWVFIFGMLGAPRMEIAGAALGTLIARIFELVFICGYFFLVDKKIAYRFYHLRMKCRDLMGEYFRISIPVLISDSLPVSYPHLDVYKRQLQCSRPHVIKGCRQFPSGKYNNRRAAAKTCSRFRALI